MSDTTDGYGTWTEDSGKWSAEWAGVVAAGEAGADPATLQELTTTGYLKVFGKKIFGSNDDE